MKPEFDYGFLSNYATVENGKLTAVGASFTFIQVPTIPFTFPISLAGRVRAAANVDEVMLRVEVIPPESQTGDTGMRRPYGLNFATGLRPGPNARPYNGKVGLLFSLSLQLPIFAVGLYRFNIHLEDELVRTLAFEAELQPSQEQ
jgi:hypothetical protein